VRGSVMSLYEVVEVKPGRGPIVSKPALMLETAVCCVTMPRTLSSTAPSRPATTRSSQLSAMASITGGESQRGDDRGKV
jgi:hypothetical protein